MDPMQMMMMQMMMNGGGLGGGQQPQAAPAGAPAAAANPQMVGMGDQLRRLAVAGKGAPAGYSESGIIPVMADGSMGTVGDDLARSASPQAAWAPEEELGWMDQFGAFLDKMDPNLRLMMGMGGLQNLGRILGGGA